MRPEVVIVGYYGRRNLGDDVLMATSHAIVSKCWPRRSVGVRVANPVPYVSRLLDNAVVQIPFGTRDRHALVVHGGGGTFFDFARHGIGRRLLSSALLSGGPSTFVRAETIVRRIARRERLRADLRLGLGIGVGCYAPGSPKLLQSLPLLADFDALWLRDVGSQTNLERLGLKVPTVVGSDLAFLHEYWCPPNLVTASRPGRARGRPRIGVVLRDWPAGSGGEFARGFAPVLEFLAQKYDVQIVSLDVEADAGTLAVLGQRPVLGWRPDAIGFREFSSALAEMDVLVTSRAHGAICGACLGRPSVIVGIEPKLAAVHAMLPRSSLLLPSAPAPRAVGLAIEEMLSVPMALVRADVDDNRRRSGRALDAVLRTAGVSHG